jgi:hypothetical protein
VQVAEIGEELARRSDERGDKCQDQSQTERIHEAKPLGIAGIDIKDNDSPNQGRRRPCKQLPRYRIEPNREYCLLRSDSSEEEQEKIWQREKEKPSA